MVRDPKPKPIPAEKHIAPSLSKSSSNGSSVKNEKSEDEMADDAAIAPVAVF